MNGRRLLVERWTSARRRDVVRGPADARPWGGRRAFFTQSFPVVQAADAPHCPGRGSLT